MSYITTTSSEHFSQKELSCPCCGVIYYDSRAVHRLERLRSIMWSPITVTSGCRCHNHNKAIRGHSNSMHLTFKKNKKVGALGFDIRIRNTNEKWRNKLIREALALGFSIGINKSFIHLDLRILDGYRQQIFYYKGVIPSWVDADALKDIELE